MRIWRLVFLPLFAWRIIRNFPEICKLSWRVTVWNREMDLDDLQRDQLFAADIKRLKAKIMDGMVKV
jgi:hypothetical protein